MIVASGKKGPNGVELAGSTDAKSICGEIMLTVVLAFRSVKSMITPPMYEKGNLPPVVLARPRYWFVTMGFGTNKYAKARHNASEKTFPVEEHSFAIA